MRTTTEEAEDVVRRRIGDSIASAPPTYMTDGISGLQCCALCAAAVPPTQMGEHNEFHRALWLAFAGVKPR